MLHTAAKQSKENDQGPRHQSLAVVSRAMAEHTVNQMVIKKCWLSINSFSGCKYVQRVMNYYTVQVRRLQY